jgi:hypothetical protein
VLNEKVLNYYWFEKSRELTFKVLDKNSFIFELVKLNFVRFGRLFKENV